MGTRIQTRIYSEKKRASWRSLLSETTNTNKKQQRPCLVLSIVWVANFLMSSLSYLLHTFGALLRFSSLTPTGYPMSGTGTTCGTGQIHMYYRAGSTCPGPCRAPTVQGVADWSQRTAGNLTGDPPQPDYRQLACRGWELVTLSPHLSAKSLRYLCGRALEQSKSGLL